MTTEQDTPAPAGDPMANAGDTALWLERTGPRRYTGRSSRGAEVLIGSTGDEGSFSPGELLKIALGACTGLSSDAALTRRLGDDVRVTIRVGGLAHPTEDRYPHLTEELEVDLSSLDDAARERLVAVVHRAVELKCTVGRTLEAGATTTLHVTEER
ncbi:OsmC family protein [Cellulomonas shaoxiangyii]|uniref:OsmC family peroxiredoxin n=1 Tax=Cellulomonas shaoxiangyii TaxID=2566013 RepID=A0A4P7SK43_9CELL|nr:OsmC family protein [Cellulomonas shaoxiangyii]QCB94520.1 OsmC family peroxiredoxin [Cellulomonas shaoxiangyii]TGY86101.1 OsmC family peroxiredoxin [Cellulomonas shaoxiangyii]